MRLVLIAANLRSTPLGQNSVFFSILQQLNLHSTSQSTNSSLVTVREASSLLKYAHLILFFYIF
jgi:hypothetical protein